MSTSPADRRRASDRTTSPSGTIRGAFLGHGSGAAGSRSSLSLRDASRDRDRDRDQSRHGAGRDVQDPPSGSVGRREWGDIVADMERQMLHLGNQVNTHGTALATLDAKFASLMDNQRLDRTRMENESAKIEDITERVTKGGAICDARLDASENALVLLENNMTLSLNKLEVVANQAHALHLRLEPIETAAAEPVYIGTPVRVAELHASAVAAGTARPIPTLEEMAAAQAQQVTSHTARALPFEANPNPMDGSARQMAQQRMNHGD